MAENRPGQILNSRPLHVYPTRHRVRQLGVDTIEEYDNNLDNLFSNNNPTMAVTPDDIAKLGKRLGAMWVRLEPFDGSQNVSDFFKDLQRYLSQTGNTTDQEKLDTLISHISGEAKALYRTLETPTFDTLKSALEERFGLTDQEKRQLKSTFYSSKQIPGETFKHYVTRMQQLAREINVPDAEVLEVCIGGARAELRPHLAMASPASVAALLKLAVVANESLVADANPQFEALNMVTNQLQQFERRMTALHTKANTDANARSQRNSRPFQRRQRNNGPHFQQAWTPPQQRRQQQTGSTSNPNNRNKNGRRTPSTSPSRQTCGRCRSNLCQRNPCRAWGLTCNKCGKRNHFAKACRTPNVTFQQQ